MKSLAGILAVLMLMASTGCHRHSTAHPQSDNPRLAAGTKLTDFTLSSNILSRNMTVRVISPQNFPPTKILPVIYLLHGAGESYRTWSNNSTIADLAAQGVILVMPDSANSYYLNDASGFRYEDYFVSELIPEIRHRFPNAATDRDHTAIVGVSRGGFGAAVLALKHPTFFSYVGGLSSAFNLPERSFRWRAPIESMVYLKVFGPLHGKTRTENDPYLLAAAIGQQEAPYFYLSCGDRDVLFDVDRRFVAILHQRRLPYSFSILSGGHNWGTWTPQISKLESSLLDHFAIRSTLSPLHPTP